MILARLVNKNSKEKAVCQMLRDLEENQGGEIFLTNSFKSASIGVKLEEVRVRWIADLFL
ncbi:MAG: hypothetical protein ACD_7C00082G0006 [uncultured bacterium]|nr:MAG: hypothetical protein ACD_7C00082G0006 [uncultured bacterium]HBR79652.1 hypothetical protein [Candidatus Moranbacteria bacterium]